jgi:integrase
MRNLRNSFTTAMVAKGYDAAMVSRLTGHVSMDVTYRHYLRPTADDFIDAFAMDLPSEGSEDLPRGGDDAS